ncbi:MAG: hypothetical protein SNJ53_06310, partial [Thermodesulfovibrionales bacterium]
TKFLSYDCQGQKKGVRIQSLMSVDLSTRGEIREGELTVEFTPPVYETVSVVLSDGDTSHTIRLNGISGKVRVDG